MSDDLNTLLARARTHKMTPEELAEQMASWVRGMTTRCPHGSLDFEQCPKCWEDKDDE